MVGLQRIEMPKWCVEYFILFFIFMVMAAGEDMLYQSGHHVCLQQTQSAHPVPFKQSYRRAVYRQTMQICEDMQLCPRIALTYQTSYRTVIHMQIRTQVVHGCCPGWQQSSPEDPNCNTPVCSKPCQNGGTCTMPEVCKCLEGWTGETCEKDVDECASFNKCQQVCQNLPGSYECSCQDGFKIADDKMSCKLCLSCVPEFQEMHDQIITLTNRIHELETEKDILLTNVSSLTRHYEVALDSMQALQEAAEAKTTTAAPKGDYSDGMFIGSMDMLPFDRLASLSEQISLLEERMADCTCLDHENRRS